MIQVNTTPAKTTRSVTTLLTDKEVQLSTTFSVKDFYGDLTNKGYFTSDEMMSYLDLLQKSPYGIQYTETFFSNIQNGLRMTNPLLVKVDKGGNEYAWMVFSNSVGTKVTLSGGMSQFIKDVQNGMIKPNFDFYDLVEEAHSLQANKIAQ